MVDMMAPAVKCYPGFPPLRVGVVCQSVYTHVGDGHLYFRFMSQMPRYSSVLLVISHDGGR